LSVRWGGFSETPGYAVYAVFSGNIDVGINSFIWRSLLVTKLVAFRGQDPVGRNIVTIILRKFYVLRKRS